MAGDFATHIFPYVHEKGNNVVWAEIPKFGLHVISSTFLNRIIFNCVYLEEGDEVWRIVDVNQTFDSVIEHSDSNSPCLI